jgi:hypothetical protein
MSEMKKCAGPEAFDREVEKKMKKMQAEQEGGIHIDINSHDGKDLASGKNTCGHCGRVLEDQNPKTNPREICDRCKERGLSKDKKLAKVVYNGTRYNIVQDGETFLVKVGSGTVGGRFNSEKNARTYGDQWVADQKKKGKLAAEDSDEKKLARNEFPLAKCEVEIRQAIRQIAQKYNARAEIHTNNNNKDTVSVDAELFFS